MHTGGFHLGSGRSQNERIDNRAWLAHLLAQARLNGSRLAELPAGRIEVHLEAGDVLSQLQGGIVCLAEITGTMTLRGAGKGATVIDVYPKNPDTLLASGFIINASSEAADVTFEGFTLEGPTSFYSQAASVSEGIGFYSSGALGATSNVVVRDVSVTGRWNVAVNITAAGKKRVTLDRFYGEGNNVVNAYYDTPTVDRATSLHVIDSHLRCYLSSFIGNAYNMYVHPSVSLRCVNTRFEDSQGTVGYAVHIFGNPSTLPAYCEFIGCDFVNCKRGVLCNKIIPTRFTGCDFYVEGNAFIPQVAGTQKGFVYANNCEFRLIGSANGNLGGGSIGGTFVECTFDDGGSTDATLVSISDGVWKFQGCSFNRTGTGAYHVGAGGEVEIDACEFASSSASYAVAPSANSRVRFHNSVFGSNVRGSYNGASAADVDFDGCHFKNSAAIRFSANNPAGVLRGRNNWFDSTTWTADAGSTGWCQIQPRHAANPNTVASAASVTLSPNYDQHHVTGTTTIANLYILDGTPAVVLFGGEVRLIADGAWALNNTGNIVPKNLAARAVGELIVLKYDPTGAKWREVL